MAGSAVAESNMVNPAKPKMIAFEVHLNGKKLCTAGIAPFGDVCVHLDRRRGPHVAKETAFQRDFELSELVVAGVRVRYKPRKAPNLKRGYAYSEALEWARREFRPGDEIKIKVVETISANKPKRLKRLS